jgi:hypothetical protein
MKRWTVGWMIWRICYERFPMLDGSLMHAIGTPYLEQATLEKQLIRATGERGVKPRKSRII